MVELCNMLLRSAHHPTTARHTNAVILTLVISEFQLTFLMEGYLDPIIYFSMIYATISFLRWIPVKYLHLHHSWTSTGLQYSDPPYMWPPPSGCFFQSRTNTACINRCNTRTLYFFLMMVFDITFETNLYPRQYHY